MEALCSTDLPAPPAQPPEHSLAPPRAADLGRVTLLPVRALERLHAFVCLLVFHAFGSPEEAGLELTVSPRVPCGCGWL